MRIKNNTSLITLKKRIKDLKAENDYLKSPLYTYDLLESVKGTYSVLLAPPVKDFNTVTNRQKATSFKLDMNEIMCVVADGKTKWIHFVNQQTSYKGERFVSNKLAFTGKIEDFCLTYDQPRIHLCKISRSVAVNPFFYILNGKTVDLIPGITQALELLKFKISQEHVDEFIQRKITIANIVSFQKIQFRDK